LEKYAALVGPANLGAVTHSGAVHWEHEELEPQEKYTEREDDA
jgi:hypothetical protein